MLVFFTNLTLMVYPAGYLVLFLLSVTDGIGWFWMVSLYKNMQLELELLNGSFFVLHFSYFTLMILLMMLSVILLSMLLILFSTLNVIRHLIFGKKYDWSLNLNLISETLWTWAGNGLLFSILGKLSSCCLISLITLVLWCEKEWVCSWGKSFWNWMFLFRSEPLLDYICLLNCHQENWNFKSFYEVFFSWGCFVSL